MPKRPNQDIMLRARQQAVVCKEQGFPETEQFLNELADEIQTLRVQLGAAEIRLKFIAAADSVVSDKMVNGHG